MDLLGSGCTMRSVTLSTDEFRAVKKMYGFTPEELRENPPAPVRPEKNASETPYEFEKRLQDYQRELKAHSSWDSKKELQFRQSGADLNAMRHAEADGLRLLAWISPFVPQGEDPLKTLIQMAASWGLDVDSRDISFADEEFAEKDEVDC
jgi:hypothetical protein